MRKTLVVLVAAMMVGMTIPAFAELQNVKVGGSLRMRANWYSEESLSFDDDTASDGSANNDALFIEQRTRINVGADFTDDVHAFIELDHYGFWGDEFRGVDSNGVVTGADGVATAGDISGGDGLDRSLASISSDGSIQLYQGYIDMKDAWGAPIDIRIGRSEMQHGDEFLVGNNDTSSFFRGLSFDGVWVKYNNDNFNVSAFATRIVQDSILESSGDTNFSGIYGSYTGLENMTIDGFYYFLHGARNASNGLATTNFLHTFGGRFAGNASQFDWALNAAYQIGDTGQLDGNGDEVEVNDFGVQGSVGYTFDINMQPRIFANGGYYSGADDDGEEGAFNRLFSDHEYSEFIDSTDLTNFWFVGGGVSAQVTEAIGLTGVANWFNSVETYEDVSGLSDEENLGLEVAIYAKYDYSEDLYFQAGYAHFFAGDAVEDGSFNNNPGQFTGGPTIGGFSSDDDVDYVFLETGISF